jgi:hypothetical protein
MISFGLEKQPLLKRLIVNVMNFFRGYEKDFEDFEGDHAP